MQAYRRLALLVACVALAVAACDQSGDSPSDARLAVSVAPLQLLGIDDACYDVLVVGGAGTVWSKGNPLVTRGGFQQNARTVAATSSDTTTLCSSRFGNSAGGDLSYVGTCDASSDSDGRTDNGVQNNITLWVDGLYRGATDLGDWIDPCAGGCKLVADCDKNADTLVEFNLTIMRRAQQGFFDVAVDFQDVFCSAKLDTCDAQNKAITLLHGGDQTRDWTAVVGLACTAGSDATATQLMYSLVQVTCGADVFTIDPTIQPGQSSVTTHSHTLDYGIYRGRENLTCGGGSCHKVYWNIAVDLADLEALNSDCTLSLAATVSDGGDGFEDGLPTTAGLAYPYVTIATQLTDDQPSPATTGKGICQQHGLDDDTHVQTVYRGDIGGLGPAPVMCSQTDGIAAGGTGANPACLAECAGATQTYNGNYTITNQASVDALRCIVHITGNLTYSTTLTTVNVPQLKLVDGAITIIDQTSLTNIGLSGLTHAGSVRVQTANALTTLDLSHVATIDGELVLLAAPNLVGTFDVSALQTLGGTLEVVQTGLSNVLAANLTGRPSLGTAANTIYAEQNPALVTFRLDKLARLYGYLQVITNANLTTLKLDKLARVDGSFRVYDDAKLADLGLLASGGVASPLITANGAFEIVGSKVPHVDVRNLTHVGLELYIANNTLLTDIHAGALTDIGGFMEVTGNGDNLTTFDLSAVGSIGGYFLVYGNAQLVNFGNLSHLTSVGGYFQMLTSHITSLDLAILTHVGGDFHLVNDVALVSVSAPLLGAISGNVEVTDSSLSTFSLPSVTSVGGDHITFANLPSLQYCVARNFVDHLTPAYTHTVTIGGLPGTTTCH